MWTAALQLLSWLLVGTAGACGDDDEVTQDEATDELFLAVDGGEAWPLAFRDTDGQHFRDLLMFQSEDGSTNYIRFWHNAEGVVDIVQPNPGGPPVFHRTQ
jgi:hypothetical protein